MANEEYYYFVASLPSLSYGDIPPKSSEAFREDCINMLDPDDAKLIDYCVYDPKLAVSMEEVSTGSPFVDKFLTRERVLMLNLAFLRAEKLGWPAPAEPPLDMPRTAAVARAAFELDDPLEATLNIDRQRWSTLDSAVDLTDVFGVSNIYIHYLKLQLLERKQVYDAEKGLANYKDCYNAIQDIYYSK